MLIILIVLQIEDKYLYDFVFIGSTWAMLEFIAVYIKKHFAYIDEITKEFKTEEYIDTNVKIDKENKIKIFISVGLIVLNTAVYLYCRLNELDDYQIIPISVSIVCVAVVSQLYLQWIDGLINFIKRKFTKAK